MIPFLPNTLTTSLLISPIAIRSVLKNHAKHGSFDTLSRLLDLRNELHRWWNSLPNSICQRQDPPLFSPSSPSQPRPVIRSEMHLRLEYCLVRMFAGRPFIFLRTPTTTTTATSRSSNQSSTASPGEQQPQQRPPGSSTNTSAGSGSGGNSNSTRSKLDARSILVTDCVEAALTIIDTCKILRDTIGSARASYTEFSACRAALLVIITQCLQSKTDRLRQALRDGVSMIKVMSAGGESARSEASLIEVFERAIARLDSSEDGVASSQGAGGGAESDYSRFKRWESLWKTDAPPVMSGRGGGGAGHGSSSTDMFSMPDTPGPMAPPPLMTGGLWGGGRDFGMEFGRTGTTTVQTGMTPSTASAAAPGTSMDWDFSAFPQTVDEFSSMFQPGSGPSPDSMGGSSANMWMGQ